MGALALDQRVGGECRAVYYRADLIGGAAGVLQCDADHVDHAAHRVVGCGQRFGCIQFAAVVECDVGKSAADIDGDSCCALVFHCCLVARSRSGQMPVPRRTGKSILLRLRESLPARRDRVKRGLEKVAQGTRLDFSWRLPRSKNVCMVIRILTLICWRNYHRSRDQSIIFDPATVSQQKVNKLVKQRFTN